MVYIHAIFLQISILYKRNINNLDFTLFILYNIKKKEVETNTRNIKKNKKNLLHIFKEIMKLLK